MLLALCMSLGAAAAKTDTDTGWWQQMRFGMFIHWGVYSKYAGQYKDSPKRYTEFVMLQARIPLAEYRREAAQWDPADFDADSLVRTAKEAGMKYLVFTSKHHDGYAMYDSPSSDYSICKVSPFGRDPLAELKDACRRHGLKLGVYYSLGRDWADPDTPTDWPVKGGRSNTWDFPDEDSKDFSRYLDRKAIPQLRELLSQYDPDIIWFDTPEKISPEQSAGLRRIIKAHNPAILINQRIGNGYGDFRVLEQAQSDSIISEPWESCVTLSRNWGFVRADREFKSPAKVIGILTDIVSKGGNLLLNAGPTDTGALRPENVEQLRCVGRWMASNGEAIYGTRPWVVYGEESDGAADAAAAKEFDDTEYDATRDLTRDLRFTAKDDHTVYVIARGHDGSGIKARTLAADRYDVESVESVSGGRPVEWHQDGDGLFIAIPDDIRDSDIPVYTFRLRLR